MGFLPSKVGYLKKYEADITDTSSFAASDPLRLRSIGSETFPVTDAFRPANHTLKKTRQVKEVTGEGVEVDTNLRFKYDNLSHSANGEPLNFLGIPYSVGKLKFTLLFQAPLAAQVIHSV